MTTEVLALSERLLAGDEHLADHTSLMVGDSSLDELGDGLAFVRSFGNVTALADDGDLLLVDAGGPVHAAGVHSAVRRWTDVPLRTAIYTHGHVDHVAAVPLFEADGDRVHVVAHARVPDRFDRYQLTNGYNGTINQRQFQLATPIFPSSFRRPDEVYDDRLTIRVGSLTAELHHDRGETDDHTWVWIPERAALCTGDLFIWAGPNCGNPQKVQRYPAEWAAALRTMADLDAELMLPGHGLPIAGRDRIRQVLTTSAEWLESLLAQTLELMNAGATLDDCVHTVAVPDHLVALPWLQPSYDDPEFVVHNIWRLYGGWYDGDPSTLKPARRSDLAAELARLAGGVDVLATRALELVDADDLRTAGHLAELAWQADPDHPAARDARRTVNRARVAAESSVMARGVFAWAAREATPSEGDR
ncbi:MAG: alkyl sulfatase dimerization domain-containing protein [Microthrixaceae bacterium]